MDKVKQKIVEKLQEKMGSEFGHTLIKAVVEEDPIHQQIKQLMKEDKIQIVDAQNNPVFQKQMTQCANYESDDDHSRVEFDNEALSEEAFSPEFNKATTKVVSAILVEVT